MKLRKSIKNRIISYYFSNKQIKRRTYERLCNAPKDIIITARSENKSTTTETNMNFISTNGDIINI